MLDAIERAAATGQRQTLVDSGEKLSFAPMLYEDFSPDQPSV